MKFKTTHLTILITLGFLFCLMIINNNNFFADIEINERKSANITERNFKNPNTSGHWKTNHIHILNDNWSATALDWIQVGAGTPQNPHIIENVTINAVGMGSGIIIEDSNDYFIIRNCTVYNSGIVSSDAAILLRNTDNGQIIENNCSNNKRHGIHLRENCNNNFLLRNNISNNRNGIFLYLSDNNSISGNTLEYNDYNGIYLDSSDNNTISENNANKNKQDGILLIVCNNNTITNNTANDNDRSGIYVTIYCNDNVVSGNNMSTDMTTSQWYGIFMTNNCKNNTISRNIIFNNTIDGIYISNDCTNNTILENTISNSTRDGIFLRDCHNNTILGNTVKENNRNGIYLEDCINNTIYLNEFIANSNNAMDNGTYNNWDNDILGNYYSDYLGIDKNGDGIGDIPYAIPGTAGSVDNFPISSPIIKIVTPENKTYKSMAGYYHATYGFENDNDGSLPFGWTGSRCSVIESLGNHKKVMEIDNNGGDIRWADNIFNQQTNGTIEFWIRTGYIQNDPQRIRVLEGANIGPDFRIMISEWHYRIGGIWYDIYQENGVDQMPAPVVNTWMHVKIEFECGNGGYKGLSPDTYRVIIDNITSQEIGFRFGDRDYIDTLSFWTGTAAVSYKLCIDAVGYSWDDNYKIGDNLNEDLLLNFKNSTNLDWMGYSLDAQTNRTILGNTTIPLPCDGMHTIQIFGNNSIGTKFQTLSRSFTVDTIAPSSLISYIPHIKPNLVNESTLFTLNAHDFSGSGVSIIKYKINNSEEFEYSTPFNLSGLIPAHYIIYYYAVDLVGNNETEDSIYVNLVEIPSTPSTPVILSNGDDDDDKEDKAEAILGYNILILVGMCLLTLGLLTRKRWKFIKKSKISK